MRAELAYCVPKGIRYSTFLGWSLEDREAALDYERAMRSCCPRCGTRPEEWAADQYAYLGQQYACPGCEVLEQERRNVPEQEREHTHVFLAPFADAAPPDEG